MTKKHTYEFVRNEFEINGCQLLSTEYTNAHTKMHFICANGHKSSITYNSFKNGTRYAKCNKNEKLTYEFVKNEFKINGYTLLETKYTNTQTKMYYICYNNHKSSTTFNNFNRGKRCRKCYGTEKLTYKFVKMNLKLMDIHY